VQGQTRGSASRVPSYVYAASAAAARPNEPSSPRCVFVPTEPIVANKLSRWLDSYPRDECLTTLPYERRCSPCAFFTPCYVTFARTPITNAIGRPVPRASEELEVDSDCDCRSPARSLARSFRSPTVSSGPKLFANCSQRSETVRENEYAAITLLSTRTDALRDLTRFATKFRSLDGVIAKRNVR